ncbi:MULTISPECIES: hypothetical protein [Aliivibrio]|uniref:hypothetical protein n=1 Tax=Aliivibrio TaxID=511678 RepID=UPI0013ED7EBB|nr:MULTISPECIES: hypothetical protein [Aliivibrio]MDD9178475.1 hypothetical protein [Aliivibrio sp. A6]
MTINSETFFQQKQAWLSNQVNVDFPTPESVKGRDVYLKQPAKAAEEYTLSSETLPETISVLLVTEHRLTIRWAITVASQWDAEYDEVLEFLTQIDLCDDYQLFVALDGMKPVAACLSQVIDGIMYVSDIALTSDAINEHAFLNTVMAQQSIQFESTLKSCIKN